MCTSFSEDPELATHHISFMRYPIHCGIHEELHLSTEIYLSKVSSSQNGDAIEIVHLQSFFPK